MCTRRPRREADRPGDDALKTHLFCGILLAAADPVASQGSILRPSGARYLHVCLIMAGLTKPHLPKCVFDSNNLVCCRPTSSRRERSVRWDELICSPP